MVTHLGVYKLTVRVSVTCHIGISHDFTKQWNGTKSIHYNSGVCLDSSQQTNTAPKGSGFRFGMKIRIGYLVLQVTLPKPKAKSV